MRDPLSIFVLLVTFVALADLAIAPVTAALLAVLHLVVRSSPPLAV